MKRAVVLFLVSLSILVSACASKEGDVNVRTDSSIPPEGSSGPEVATTLLDNGAFPSQNLAGREGQADSASSITFADNGKTFTYKVGDSFLLDLGAGIYAWEVTLGSQEIFVLRSDGTIRGAQGTFEALNPGTVTLTAVGEPLCRKASPPCGMPTVLFKVTLVVE